MLSRYPLFFQIKEKFLKIFLQTRTTRTSYLNTISRFFVHLLVYFCNLNSSDQKIQSINSFKLFPNVTVSLSIFLAFSFEKRIENFLISYFIYSQHSCSSVICPADTLLQINFKCFSSVMKSGLWLKELLNFHKPLALGIPIFLDNEKNMGE